MPNWLIKSALHRVITWLPRPQFWSGVLQHYFTKSTTLTSQSFEHKVAECRRHFEALAGLNPSSREFTAFELGTGWFAIIPVGLYLCGASEVWTIDIQPLLRSAAIRQVLELYSQCERAGALEKILPARRMDRVERLRALLARAPDQNASSILEQFKIHVLVADARATPIPSRAVNFFVSSGVLEYIPGPVLKAILAEFKRISALGAVMSHRINLADQYSSFDSSITPFNFLRYSEEEWRWRNSPLIWQNRLRISDYRRLLAEAGFELVQEESTRGRPQDLARVKLAPQFQSYSREDLLVLHSLLTARLSAHSSSSDLPHRIPTLTPGGASPQA